MTRAEASVCFMFQWGNYMGDVTRLPFKLDWLSLGSQTEVSPGAPEQNLYSFDREIYVLSALVGLGLLWLQDSCGVGQSFAVSPD